MMASIVDQLWQDAGMPLIEEMNGVTVSFHRGDASANLSAIADSMDCEVDNGNGYFESVQLRDYTLRVADVVIGDVAVEPQRGDRIIEIIAGISRTFEVMALPTKQAVSLSHDGTRWLVHTKEVT